MKWPQQGEKQLSSVFDRNADRGTLGSISADVESQNMYANSSRLSEVDYSINRSDSGIDFPNRTTLRFLDSYEHLNMRSMYEELYAELNVKVHRRVEMMGSIFYKGEVFRSSKSQTIACNLVRAKWLGERFPQKIDPSTTFQRAGQVEEIFSSKVVVDGVTKEHIIMKISWYAKHDNTYHFGNHLHLYNKRLCDQGPYSYLPIQRIACKCALYYVTVDHVKCAVVIPLLGIWGIC